MTADCVIQSVLIAVPKYRGWRGKPHQLGELEIKNFLTFMVYCSFPNGERLYISEESFQ